MHTQTPFARILVKQAGSGECKKLGVCLATWVCGNKKKQMGILILDAMKHGKIHKKN